MEQTASCDTTWAVEWLRFPVRDWAAVGHDGSGSGGVIRAAARQQNYVSSQSLNTSIALLRPIEHLKRNNTSMFQVIDIRKPNHGNFQIDVPGRVVTGRRTPVLTAHQFTVSIQ